MKIDDISTTRSIHIDGSNKHIPTSVFIVVRGTCMEFDRQEFLEAFRVEFDLVPLAFAAMQPA